MNNEINSTNNANDIEFSALGSSLDTKSLIKQPDQIPLTTIQISKYCAFWFGHNFYWFLLSVAIVPNHIQKISGDENKGSGLSIISFTSGVLVLFVSILIGAINDNFRSRYGKRGPWLIVGTVCSIISTFLFLWPTNSLGIYTLGYCLLTFFAQICGVPFNGLITDISPTNQKGRGQVSAVMGAVNLLGYLFGAILGVFSEYLGTEGLYIIISIVYLISAIITVSQFEPPKNYSTTLFHFDKKFNLWGFLRHGKFYEPLLDYDFRLLFISRFLFQISISTIQQFLQYFIEDCASSGLNDMAAVSLALIPLLVLSPIGAFFIPESRRKIVVYVSSVFMVMASVMMIFARQFWMSFVISGVFGIGYGPFISVEFAMLMDILPNHETAARDISIWHMALVLPQLTATPSAGIIRDYFERIGKQHNLQCLGYQVVFSCVVCYLIWGVYMTSLLKRTK